MLLSKLFPLYAWMMWAADAGDGGGGDPGNTSTGEGDKKPGVTDPPTGGEKPGGATFTQADLDRIAGQTRKEALSKWAKEHGFADVKDLETVIKAKQDADEQAKTDLQKAKDNEAREKAAREAAEARLYGTILRSAFDRIATGKIADDLIDAAYLTAKEAGLLNGDSGIVVDVEAGKVTGMDKVVEKLLKDKPSFKKTSQAAPAGTGGAEGGNTTPAPTAEQEIATRRTYGIRPRRQ